MLANETDQQVEGIGEVPYETCHLGQAEVVTAWAPS